MPRFLLFLLLSISAFGQIEEHRRITKTLCSPEFHGRGYVNHGDSLAADFIRKEYQLMGLSPLSDGYLQPFSFQVNSFPGDLTVQHQQQVLLPGRDFLVHPASPSIEAVLNPAVFRAADLLNADLASELMSRYLSSDSLNAFLLDFSRISQDTLKLLKGIERSLSDFKPVLVLSSEKFTWSVAREQLKNPVIYLHDSLDKPYLPYQVKIQAELLPKHQAYNVVGVVPARKKSKKYLVFTAHYDHLGRMGRDTYFPGANDNASGTAMLLALARHFAAKPHKYNCVFIAFAGEEAGLLGSSHFVTEAPISMKKIRFLINLDILGSGEEGITVVNATLFKKEFEKLKTLNESGSYMTTVKSRGPAANSDHYWFTEKGVPAFYIYTMGPNKHYHDVFDTYEELSFAAFESLYTLLSKFAESVR